MKTRFIHIGYPKTGTVALQKDFFVRHPEIFYLGRSKHIDPDLRRAVLVDILRKDSFAYSEADIEQIFAVQFEIAESQAQCRAVGISYEDISFSLDGSYVDRALIAQRLHRLFGNAKIIIMIRNQFDFIRSLYSESIKLGCFFSFKQFLEAHYWRFYTYLFHQLYYYDLYRYYRDLFGREQVRIYLFEEFTANPNTVVGDICDFLGISPLDSIPAKRNVGLSEFSLACLRLLNRFVRHNFGRSYFLPVGSGALLSEHPLPQSRPFLLPGVLVRDVWRAGLKRLFHQVDTFFGLKPARPPFTAEWRETIEELYSENNRKLADETGLDLSRYGYPIRESMVCV